MKSSIFIFFIFLSSLVSYSQSVSINEDGSVPDQSAMLDIKSTTKGMLIPRMTSAERTGILNPGVGLLVYDNETASFWFYKAAGWTELITGGGAGTNYWDTDGNHIYNNNTGNVGIGTNNPTARLSIQSPINTTGFTHVGGADSIVVFEAIGGVSAAIGVSTNHVLRLAAGAQGKVQVYPDGNVVIGDNNAPIAGKFTVQTPYNSDGITHISENGALGQIKLATRVGGTSAGIGTFTNTHMRIFANSLSAITITGSNGNVGVGIDFPVNKFEVNGTIRSKELIVESINWPDYVFDEKYKLPLLCDVEKFIHQNKHLPNIPSSAEIEKSGLHLGETQKRMMEKIEELTLYVIELSHKIKMLESTK
ncbi:MAG: hypothetical protein ABI760_02155 [Ferruginibacter sp.]